MKILITYFSNTGNTEKVANSLKEGLEDEVVDLVPINNVEPSSLKNYDLKLLQGVLMLKSCNLMKWELM